MFRIVLSAVRAVRPLASTSSCLLQSRIGNIKNFSNMGIVNGFTSAVGVKSVPLLDNIKSLALANSLTPLQTRTVTKFSLKKGKRKTVKAVLKRFFRLHWGAWIRPKVGRNKKIWKKSEANRRRLRQHVFCNATQSTLLDKMVTKFWKKPKYYVDDPYAPYHTREEFMITRRKPIVRH